MKKKISEEVLIAEYAAVFRYLLYLCKDKAEAEDITQETFLKAMKGYSKFEEESSLYTWLCAIGKNIWLNRLRKKNTEVPMAEGQEFFSEDNVENTVLKKDMTMQIHRVLHQLDEPYKEVFSLRIFGELSYKEIASLFSKSESWARVTFHRGKKEISEKLREDGAL